ncbi:ribosomal RNA large subunit methyltransferase J [Diaporthe helianthi]|uniref:rRNA methyltransferase 2, mitochondrial n=1 Tax=Diaporthe helianthi TaxID=158607 RepID=A0A2P5I3F1_DIAHE|nr:ribosomal RNA large subunit methyltransferase J [Diaporthe helianthi]
MATALGGASCRRVALSEQLISRVLSHLTLASAVPASRGGLPNLNACQPLFRRNQVVVDLGYAPGSWSQVAKDATGPNGVIVGIDLIPAQPPRGVTSIQGDFLSPKVRALVKHVLAEQVKRRDRVMEERQELEAASSAPERLHDDAEASQGSVVPDQPSYIDQEKQATQDIRKATGAEEAGLKMVDVVISDMSEPWPQTSRFRIETLSNPYRLMNASGIKFGDHARSMDLCYAALTFASDTLKIGGHFVCKFYQGAEDKSLQKMLEKMFTKVHREKPESSRDASKEAYFVALNRLDVEPVEELE